MSWLMRVAVLALISVAAAAVLQSRRRGEIWHTLR